MILIWDLKRTANDLPPKKKFVALLHDEIKVKADLVYDKRSGQIVGFTNPETWRFKEIEYIKHLKSYRHYEFLNPASIINERFYSSKF